MATLGHYKMILIFAILHVSRGQTWIRKPHDVNATVGSDVQVPCETSGTAQNTIIWSKGADPIFVKGQRGIGVSGRYTVDGSNTLLIRNVEKSDEADYTCNIFGFSAAQMHLKVTNGSITCLSCSAVEGSFACNHSISCLPEESCYTHHYRTNRGRDVFDFGCADKQSCPSVASKRDFNFFNKDGRLNLCISCCDNADSCNKHSRCEKEFKGSNRSCLSCNEVSANSTCENAVTCSNNEVCYTHHYRTEYGDNKYEFGCSNPQSCPSLSQLQIIGKRSEGRRSICYTCCNGTDVCNQQTRCNNDHEGAKHLLQDCASLGLVKKSGVYTIFPYNRNGTSVKAYCERESDGTIWTVIQRRVDGSVNFTRDWMAYKNGFGNPAGDYWIGNDVIHALTSADNYELRVVLSDVNGTTKWAHYGYFGVDAESQNYRLHISSYTGNAGDALTKQNGNQFSTTDRINYSSYRNYCGYNFNTYSGWWFSSCRSANLNGRIRPLSSTDYRYYMNWNEWYIHLGSTSMMIRRAP